MIVADEAFDELLDRAALVEEAARGDEVEGEARRRLFALCIDRAVKKAASQDDERAWHTQTLKRYGCRLHFLRSERRLYLIACVALDDDEDYST